jgi:DNA excision repair protein ERCC-2
MPENRRQLHWAQARVYGALLCRERGLTELELALVYFDVGSQQETVLSERHPAAALEAFFVLQCERFQAWAEQELAHRAARDRALGQLRFPHGSFRHGQRALAEAVYKTTVAGRCLLMQAPTGIGKTVGTIFPVLKAWPAQGLDKLFFLTAKTPGRAPALQALRSDLAEKPALLAQFSLADKPLDALEAADALIIVTEWKAYRSPNLVAMKRQLRQPLIIDGRNLYEPDAMQAAGFRYLAVGRPMP